MANSIGIIGYGIVGQALAYGFSKNTTDYQILFYDKFKESTPLEEVVKKSDFIFICLPTPIESDESGIDLSIIETTISQIVHLTNNTDKIIVIKSTVIPGTTARLEKQYPKSHFANNPEFLTENNYLDDFLNADRTIIGATSGEVSQKLATFYQKRFPKTKIYQTDLTSAEMVKYMANTFLATKVLFAYEMYDLCQKLGIDYMKVKEIVVSDKRIGDTHLNVSSSNTANSNTTDKKGFSGKCFPKDMVSLIGLGKKIGADMSLLERVWEKNKKIRKIHDWEDIPFAVSKKKRV